MVEFKRERKTYAENDSVKVKTDNGDFEVSLEENGCLYLGFCVPQEDKLPESKTFRITSENNCFYVLTESLYESFKNVSELEKHAKECESEPMLRMIRRDNPYYEGKVIWYSDDFKIQEASVLTIEKDSDNSYTFTFTRSKSKNTVNTYFVCISDIYSRYTIFNKPFMNFYKNLLIYEKDNNIITFSRIYYSHSYYYLSSLN